LKLIMVIIMVRKNTINAVENHPQLSQCKG
jgi:hypothetical protein